MKTKLLAAIDNAEFMRKEYERRKDDVVMRDDCYEEWNEACDKLMEIAAQFSKKGGKLTAEEARLMRCAMGG